MDDSPFVMLTETRCTMGADFSTCRKYRYVLWRRWNDVRVPEVLAFVGLNPSTADESTDDPTIRRCIGFAKSLGYDAVVMLNVFAFRATKPEVMKRHRDPNGPLNDESLSKYGKAASMVIAAWGNHCPSDRQESVVKLIGRDVHCLGINASGTPKHPLYLPKNSEPSIFRTGNNG